ncbi:MAG: hypothetical protein IKG95_05405 [Bacteroidales bacterium]|nr:hypothetical protein [Bacteroidales bacterium]
MEQQENNNLSELDQLKAQYETLKQQFDQQEIVNDRLMKSSIKHSTDFYKRYRWLQVVLYPLAALLGVLIIKWDMGNNLSAKVFWVAFCATCLVIELLLTRKLQLKTLENDDLLTLANRARDFKKLFATFTILNYSTGIILTLGMLLAWIGKGAPNLGAVTVVFCIAIVIFVLVGIAEIRYKTKPCDDIIHQIEAADTSCDKKPRLDPKQKWFFIAMIVVFLGFDVWGGYLIAKHLKIVGDTIHYERTTDDLSTKGSLEIWEVYNWIRVPDKERYLETTTVEDNDSLAYRWSADTTDFMLYTLKKTTKVGPAISSAVLGGKPLVKRLDTGPYKEGTFTAIILELMPEATILFKRMTEEALLQPQPVNIAVVIDGLVYQDWRIANAVSCAFFINANPNWSKEEVETFCEQLIKQ